jgi:NAD+ synthetase
VHVCEDSWHPQARPSTLLQHCGVDALLNLSASPYERGKLRARSTVIGETARVVGAPVLYCNLVGGQDELVFDGASMALSNDDTLLARAASFKEELLYVQLPPSKAGAEAVRDLSTLTQAVQVLRLDRPQRAAAVRVPATTIAPTLDDLAEVYAALETGLRDYTEKNGFKKVLVAVSGGIDSALVLSVAADALGPDRVVGVTMPSQYSSSGTLSDAQALGRNFGVTFHTLPIARLFQTYLDELGAFWETGKGGLAEENLQARIRGNLIMAFSNKMGWLVLSCGNKSEHATGYATLYGDMCGGFAVIKDLPKVLVYQLARWRNSQEGYDIIPAAVIERAPSAELRPDQRDTDSLPEYDTLDPILEAYVENDLSAAQIIARGFDPAVVSRVISLVDRNEYKRRQGPPGIKITARAFGRDRRVPITNAYKAHEALNPQTSGAKPRKEAGVG